MESGKLKMSGFFAWLAWCFVHVLYLIGFHNRILVMTTWIWSYLTWKRGARLITTHIAKRPDPVKRDAVAALEAAVTELRDDRAP